jgi:pyrimidine operon attenuation protein/uracil phosphoribosyltransferase
MSVSENTSNEAVVIMTEEMIDKAITRIAQEIVHASQSTEPVLLLGILSRGRPLADRIAARILEDTGVASGVGSLATTLHRDDVHTGIGFAKMGGGETHFDFDVDGATVVLVDDVIAKGRTVRAAMDEVMHYGRPDRIQLACLIDRGQRELPIQPDYLGWSVASEPGDHVSVRLNEIDGEDVVLLHKAEQDAHDGPEAVPSGS